jgi:hypothetical protein
VQQQQQTPKAMQLPLRHSHHVLLQLQLLQAPTAAGCQAADHPQLDLAQQQQQRVAPQSLGHPSALV